MATNTVTDRPTELTTSREPGPAAKADADDIGAQALKDATLMVIACWVFILFLSISLHKFNV